MSSEDDFYHDRDILDELMENVHVDLDPVLKFKLRVRLGKADWGRVGISGYHDPWKRDRPRSRRAGLQPRSWMELQYKPRRATRPHASWHALDSIRVSSHDMSVKACTGLMPIFKIPLFMFQMTAGLRHAPGSSGLPLKPIIHWRLTTNSISSPTFKQQVGYKAVSLRSAVRTSITLPEFEGGLASDDEGELSTQRTEFSAAGRLAQLSARLDLNMPRALSRPSSGQSTGSHAAPIESERRMRWMPWQHRQVDLTPEAGSCGGPPAGEEESERPRQWLSGVERWRSGHRFASISYIPAFLAQTPGRDATRSGALARGLDSDMYRGTGPGLQPRAWSRQKAHSTSRRPTLRAAEAGEHAGSSGSAAGGVRSGEASRRMGLVGFGCGGGQTLRSASA